MFFEGRQSNYEKHPYKNIEGYDAYQGYESILNHLRNDIQNLKKESVVVCLDFYHGTRNKEVLDNLILPLSPDHIIFSEDAKKSEEEIQDLLGNNITNDRVFGVLTTEILDHLFDESKLKDLKAKIKPGLTVIYGVGASLVDSGDIHLYFDLTRWEIQLRYRLGNWTIGAQVISKKIFLENIKEGTL